MPKLIPPAAWLGIQGGVGAEDGGVRQAGTGAGNDRALAFRDAVPETAGERQLSVGNSSTGGAHDADLEIHGSNDA